MHPTLLDSVIKDCRERIAAGDCPPPVKFSREWLEEAVVMLADRWDDALLNGDRRPTQDEADDIAQRAVEAAAS